MDQPSFAARLARWTFPVLCLLASGAFAERARTWTLIELTADAPAGGIARAVNDRGDVAGQWMSPGSSFFSSVSHAFVWRGGTRQELQPAGARTSIAWAVNQRGTVAGSVDGVAHTWSDGEATSLQITGQAVGINDRGEVVGRYWPSGTLGVGHEAPFLFRDGVLFELPTLGGFQAGADDVNDAGIVVGRAAVPDSSASHAVLWENGVIRDLGTLGGRNSWAVAINNRGDILGRSQLANGSDGMALWHADGGPPQFLLDRANPTAINNRGAIVGQHLDTGQAFLYEDGAVTWFRDVPAIRAGGWTAFTPWGINDRAWVVGSAWKPGKPFAGTAVVLIPD